jgi:hypothetical protein
MKTSTGTVIGVVVIVLAVGAIGGFIGYEMGTPDRHVGEQPPIDSLLDDLAADTPTQEDLRDQRRAQADVDREWLEGSWAELDISQRREVCSAFIDPQSKMNELLGYDAPLVSENVANAFFDEVCFAEFGGE